MRLFAQSRGTWRDVLLALSLIAILMRILAPPGFMTVAAPDGLRLVICTGHGPLRLDDRTGPSKPAPSSAKIDPPCLFAGGTAAPTPETPRILASRLAAARVVSDPARTDIAANSAPAGAPPPARGPPGE